MEPIDDDSSDATRKSGSRTFIIIAIIIIASIAAFLILRPNPSGTNPKNNSVSPASTR
jgi:hypothetical protein